MHTGEPKGPLRTHIVLEGGGRLDDVAHIADIRLEAEPLEWTWHPAGHLEVRGALNAYLYCLRPRGRGIEGEGFRIPFSRRIEVGHLHGQTIDVRLEQIDSKHDFNPVTGDFQHTVSAVVSVYVPTSAELEPTESSEVASPKESLSQAKGQGKPTQKAETQTEQAHGETRMSQIAQAPRPQSDDDATPAANRPPTPEEFETLRQAAEGVDKEERIEDTREAKETKNTEEAGEAGEGASKPKDSRKPLVWKPFPPPIS